MREDDLDIIELILKKMPTNNELQDRIKLYMQSHKTNCNEFIYSQYKREATFFNTILKAIMCDLSAEIIRTLQQKDLKEGF